VSGNPTAGGGSSFDYTQFFATGASAENLARNSAVKKLYQTEGARDAEALLNYVRRFSQCVAAPDGSFDAKRLGAALDRAAVDKAITSDDVTFLKSAKSTVQLQDLITGGAQDTGPKLAAYVLLHKDLCSRTS
jgi:hypothetical protein